MKYAFIWRVGPAKDKLFVLEYAADMENHHPTRILARCTKQEAIDRSKADGAIRWNF